MQQLVILFSKYLVPKGYVGITIYPFVFLRNATFKENRVLVNHETIHLRQQIELLIVFFYVFYSLEFIVRLMQYKNWNKAYRNISFEREAYINENDLNYLKKRPFWKFYNFL